MFKGLSFDAPALFVDLLSPTEVDIRRGQVLQALVIAVVIVVLDEAVDLGFEIAEKLTYLWYHDPPGAISKYRASTDKNALHTRWIAALTWGRIFG